MASRRYRSKNTLNSNISDIDNRLQNLETRPSPRRIAANAIGAAQLQEEAVGEGVIAPGVIEGASIAGGAVGAAQIQDLIVTAEKIFDGAITSVKIAEGAVTSAALAANSVTAVTIAVGAVVNEKLAANAVQSINILANAIDSTKIAADAVTSLQIAANAVGSLEIAPNSVVIGKIAANAVDSAAIEAAAITGTKIAANAVTANAIMANSITASKIDAAAVTADAIAANAITANAIAANAVTANAISANSITGVKIAANTITGNNILAGSVTGDRITANTLYGNTIVANTLFGNSIVANTLSGNTVIANTLIGNSIVANSLNGNTVIANSLSGNTIVANTLSGNTVIANTISGNTIIANTLSGNTVIANSLMGNTVVANTLFGNAIVAGSITGDRITGTTTIRLADSLLASPVNYIQFGYITLPGASGAGPGIMGAYSSTPSFYLGGFSSGGTSGNTGFSLGIYDNQGGTPVPYGVLSAAITNAGGANPYSATSLASGVLSLSSYGGSYSDPSFGSLGINTTWGDITLAIAQAGVVNGNGEYARIRLQAPTLLTAGAAYNLTSKNHYFQIGLSTGDNIRMDADGIQAVSNGAASGININTFGGTINAGSSTSTVTVNGYLRVESTGDVSVSSTTHGFQIGPTSGINLRVDNNEIQGVNNGAASGINIQASGGATVIGAGGGSVTLASGAGNVVIASGGGDTTVGATGNALASFILGSKAGTPLVDFFYRWGYTASIGAARTLSIASTGLVGYTGSSRQFKQDIEDLSIDVPSVLSVVPKKFKYKTDVERLGSTAEMAYGFIAEDLDGLGLSPFVDYDESGNVFGIDYPKYVVALQAVARHQASQIELLSSRLDALEARL